MSKKTGRVKDVCPPPSEHSRVNILLGLSCPKRFFVKKKNIGRVNPGRGGVDDPPPQKIVGLKFYWVVLSIV